MSGDEAAPFLTLLLLMALIPFAFPAAKAVNALRERITAYRVSRRQLAIARSVGVDEMALAACGTHAEQLVLIRTKVAEQLHLLIWRAIRLVERARRNELPEEQAAKLIRRLEYNLALTAADGDAPPLLWLDPSSAFYRRFAEECDELMALARPLVADWQWTTDWLRYARKVKP